MTHTRALLVLLMAGLGAAAPATGQSTGATTGSARLHGTVVDFTSGRPLAQVRITLLGSSRFVSSDSTGRFDFADLPTGINRFLVYKEGFPRTTLALPFGRGESLEHVLQLDSTKRVAAGEDTARRVAGVEVTEERPPDRRYADFDRRRRSGRGQYVTREQIEQRQYNQLVDVFRSMRGVTVECGGGGGCYARMVRAPIGCVPQYIVDERPQPHFGLTTPIRDIEGVEVYTGAADVPGEYAGLNAGCGVIVVWTRNGPPKRAAAPRKP